MKLVSVLSLVVGLLTFASASQAKTQEIMCMNIDYGSFHLMVNTSSKTIKFQDVSGLDFASIPLKRQYQLEVYDSGYTLEAMVDTIEEVTVQLVSPDYSFNSLPVSFHIFVSLETNGLMEIDEESYFCRKL
jgi:hypothetical protein